MPNKIPLEKLTVNNKNFRKVVHTGKFSQLVLMSLKPKEDINLEIHKNHDQYLRIEKGKGKLFLGKKTKKIISFKNGDMLIVPANTWHRVKNTSKNSSLKLYTIYSPPEHPKGTIQKNKI